MVISKVTKDLRRLLDAQNILWEDYSTDSIERTCIPLDDGTSVDDYAFTTPKTPEEVLEVLGRRGTK